MAYIVTGIIIGPLAHFHIQNQETLRVMAQLGVTLLLFILGLELRFKDLRSLGGVILASGALQIIISVFVGVDLLAILHVPLVSAIYVSLALTFSSTIVIVTLLSDKKDLKSLYGKISVGILLVQDFFAIFVLIILSAFPSANTTISILPLLFVLVKAAALCCVVFFIGRAIFPKIIHLVSYSQEMLFLFSLAWVFALSSFVSTKAIGFPIEIGGFLAGITLAGSVENLQIVARIRPLRDFFITIFFVTLGMQMSIHLTLGILIPVIILSLFVIVIKPFIVLCIIAVFGYRRRTSFLTALNFTQISEFSLIMLFLGEKLGFVSSTLASEVTIVAVIAFATSSYTIAHGNSLYRFFADFLTHFEKQKTIEMAQHLLQEELDALDKHVAVIGAHRAGQSILDSLLAQGESVVVVDFDPDVVAALKKRNVLSIFGDISDLDIQDRLAIDRAKLVISTVSDIDDNLILIKRLNKTNRRAKIIVLGQDQQEAKELYRAGADYVMIPYIIGGHHLAKIIKENKLDSLSDYRQKEAKYY